MGFLIIAEKPSLARDIADALTGNRTNGKDYITVGDFCITWALGHLLELKEPEDINPAFADRNNLDILPLDTTTWGLKIRASEDGSVASRVLLIGKLLAQASYVIHAGDPDDEGQLLIDELLRWHGYSGPVYRLDTGNTTKDALSRALRNMKDNKTCEMNGWAADARRRADKAAAYTLSRFFSTLNGTNLPVGRVKCPTLGLVVARDAEIANHQKVFFYKVKAQLRLQNGALIEVEYIPDDNDPNLTDGKILQKQYAERIMADLSNLRGIARIEKNPVTSKPPLPFNLVALQKYCSQKFSYLPDATLAITQSLRDKYKAITYNRTDCQYLSDEHFKEAPKTTTVTMQNLGVMIPTLNCNIRSRCFNSNKIKTHFAIIPSGQRVNINAMTAQERNVYIAISQFYLAQFMPNAQKEKSTLTMPLERGCLRASSTEIKNPGFLALDMLGGIDEDEPPSILSRIPADDYMASVEASEVKDCETKPKPKYTPASLIVDMTRIARYVEDPYIRDILIKKDEGDDSANGSIGTDATRTGIVNDLLLQGYCEMQGKNIVSTAKGREFYRILPDEFKKADLTAHWWVMQEAIKSGEMRTADLLESVVHALQDVLMQEYPRLDTSKFGSENREPIGKCPICQTGQIMEGRKAFYCTEFKPKNEGCRFYIPKESNTGVMSRTPISSAMIKKLIAGKPVYVRTLWTKKKQETGQQKEEYQLSPGKLLLDTTPVSQFLIRVSFDKEPLGACPMCGTGTVLEGKFAFGCSNYAAEPPCNFRVRKNPNPENQDSIFSRLKITKTMMQQLLAGKTVKNAPLWSKDKQKEYAGEVALKKEENGEVHLAPVFREYGDVIGTCPRCGGAVKEAKYAYQCENPGCNFRLWKTSKQGLMSKVEIRPDVAQKLILGEKVTIGGLWSSSKKKKFAGTIYLDDSARKEYGPDIKLVPFAK